MDPDNPIVQLCVQGMQAESKGRSGEAASLFAEAWDESSNDFERCVAAHYVARHQSNSTDSYSWNAKSLELADVCGDDRVRAFYPSLYLNMGKSCEEIGDSEGARRFYSQANECLAELPEGPYGAVVRHGVAAALDRVKEVG